MRAWPLILLILPWVSGCLDPADAAAKEEDAPFSWAASAGYQGEGRWLVVSGSVLPNWQSWDCDPQEPYALCNGQLEVEISCWLIPECKVDVEVEGYVQAKETIAFDLTTQKVTREYEHLFLFEGPSSQEGATTIKATFFTQTNGLPRIEHFVLASEAHIEFHVN